MSTPDNPTPEDLTAAPTTVLVNGEPHQITAGETVYSLVRSITSATRGIAVSMNGEVIPRSQWERAQAHGNIEIVTAAQGG